MRDERWFGASIGAEPFCLILQLRDHKYKIISLDLVSVPNDCSIPLQNIEEITRGLGVVVLSRPITTWQSGQVCFSHNPHFHCVLR